MPENAMSNSVRAAPPSAPGGSGGSAFRRLYARAADPEVLVPDGELIDVIREELSGACSGGGHQLDALMREAADWSSASMRRFAAVGEHGDLDVRQLLARRAALAWAPLGLAAGA